MFYIFSEEYMPKTSLSTKKFTVSKVEFSPLGAIQKFKFPATKIFFAPSPIYNIDRAWGFGGIQIFKFPAKISNHQIPSTFSQKGYRSLIHLAKPKSVRVSGRTQLDLAQPTLLSILVHHLMQVILQIISLLIIPSSGMWKRKSGSSLKGSKGGKRRKLAGGRYWSLRSGTYRRGQGSFLTDQAGPQYSLFNAGRQFVKFRTNGVYSLSSTSGAFSGAKIIKLNSLVDPLGTLGSVKAQGYDQWLGSVNQNGIYQSYQVQAYWVKLTVLQNNIVPFTFGTVPEANSTGSATTMSQLLGRRMSKVIDLGYSTGAGSVKSMVQKGSIAQVVGDIKDSVLIDATYSANAGSDPATTVVLFACGQSSDTTTTGGVFVRIQLIQYAMLFGPNVPTQT